MRPFQESLQGEPTVIYNMRAALSDYFDWSIGHTEMSQGGRYGEALVPKIANGYRFAYSGVCVDTNAQVKMTHDVNNYHCMYVRAQHSLSNQCQEVGTEKRRLP